MQTLKQRIDDYAKAEKATIAPPKAGDKKHDKAKVKAELAASQERRDRLDREGVMLWNRSTALKQSRLVLGATRQADQPDLNQGEEGSNSATAEEKEFQQLISLGTSLSSLQLIVYELNGEIGRFVAARLVELGSNKPHLHAGEPGAAFPIFRAHIFAHQISFASSSCIRRLSWSLRVSKMTAISTEL